MWWKKFFLLDYLIQILSQFIDCISERFDLIFELIDVSHFVFKCNFKCLKFKIWFRFNTSLLISHVIKDFLQWLNLRDVVHYLLVSPFNDLLHWVITLLLHSYIPLYKIMSTYLHTPQLSLYGLILLIPYPHLTLVTPNTITLAVRPFAAYRIHSHFRHYSPFTHPFPWERPS